MSVAAAPSSRTSTSTARNRWRRRKSGPTHSITCLGTAFRSEWARGHESPVCSGMNHPNKGWVYLFESKVLTMAPEGTAMNQLKDRRYADKYQASGQPIWLIGVEFRRDTRNVAAFEVERV